MENPVIVDDAAEKDNAKYEMAKIQEEEIKMRGGLWPKNGFGHAIDPGGTDQDSAYTRPGVEFASDQDVCAGGQPNKGLHEGDERECDGAPERDCDGVV